MTASPRGEAFEKLSFSLLILLWNEEYERSYRAPLVHTLSSFLLEKEITVENNYRKGFADISTDSDIAPLQRLRFLLQGQIGAKMAVGMRLDCRAALTISENLPLIKGQFRLPL